MSQLVRCSKALSTESDRLTRYGSIALQLGQPMNGFVYAIADAVSVRWGSMDGLVILNRGGVYDRNTLLLAQNAVSLWE